MVINFAAPILYDGMCVFFNKDSCITSRYDGCAGQAADPRELPTSVATLNDLHEVACMRNSMLLKGRYKGLRPPLCALEPRFQADPALRQ